ncbi:MAG TPA: LPS export ABC transporter ATP-binding protein [Spirochaetota bacterium]|nr:LPS export ABC transporter ATP-binding protein [Spirochaetota bacterium]
MFTLSVKNITKIYSKRRVVNDVSYHVQEGEIVGLLGPNGAGKTTSFYIAVGLIKPDYGNIYCNDKSVLFLPMYKRARLGLGYLPQESSIFRKLSAEDNIKAVLEVIGKSKEEIEERTDYLLKLFKIEKVRTQAGHTLSGGERRRVEIARAVAADPKILLLDEPFAGIDPLAVKDIQDIVQRVRELGLGILITDHNVRETLKIVSRGYIMSHGQILRQGTADELINDPEAKRVYLGEDFAL